MRNLIYRSASGKQLYPCELYRLTNTDITALQQEADELNKKIIELQAILQSEKRLLQVLKQI